jgi:SRSO17 transposase
VERKNVEAIASQLGPNRLGLYGFMGWADWDDEPLRQALLGQGGKQWGQGDGVLVFDPSAFPKSGRESVGVARQWGGRLGQSRQLSRGHLRRLRVAPGLHSGCPAAVPA